MKTLKHKKKLFLIRKKIQILIRHIGVVMKE